MRFHSLPRSAAGLLLVPILTWACSPASGPVSSAPVPHSGESATGSADDGRRPTRSSPTIGLLVMAHGGGGAWDQAVDQALAPLREERPTALALGMADPATLGPSLDSLRHQGVERVAVVRLFVSGTSFLVQTRYLLGLGPAPAYFISHHGTGHGMPDPIAHGLEVATHVDGLVDHDVTGRILVDRSTELSVNPESESVLWLAHGQGDSDANARLESAMARWAGELEPLGFAATRPATLREDWPEARKQAEAGVRSWVADQAGQGRRVLVVPLRVSGFGPYRDVLSELPYEEGTGLLPHPAITDWIREKFSDVAAAEGWSEVRFVQSH